MWNWTIRPIPTAFIRLFERSVPFKPRPASLWSQLPRMLTDRLETNSAVKQRLGHGQRKQKTEKKSSPQQSDIPSKKALEWSHRLSDRCTEWKRDWSEGRGRSWGWYNTTNSHDVYQIYSWITFIVIYLYIFCLFPYEKSSILQLFNLQVCNDVSQTAG